MIVWYIIVTVFFVPWSGCKSLEVLQLSQVKVSDRGVQHLLHQPLEHLLQLDLSNTLISSRTLALLPNGIHIACTGSRIQNIYILFAGAPQLEILNIESTKVCSFIHCSYSVTELEIFSQTCVCTCTCVMYRYLSSTTLTCTCTCTCMHCALHTFAGWQFPCPEGPSPSPHSKCCPLSVSLWCHGNSRGLLPSTHSQLSRSCRGYQFIAATS